MTSSIPCLCVIVSPLLFGQQTDGPTPKERFLRSLDEMNVVVAIWTESGRSPTRAEPDSSLPCSSLVIFADGRALVAASQNPNEPAVVEKHVSGETIASLVQRLRKDGFFARESGITSKEVPDGESISILVRSGEDLEILSVWPRMIGPDFPQIGSDGQCGDWDGERAPVRLSHEKRFLDMWLSVYRAIRDALGDAADDTGVGAHPDPDTPSGDAPNAGSEADVATTLAGTLQRLKQLRMRLFKW